MEYRPLGRTGLHVSQMALGAAAFGGAYGTVTDTDTVNCVATALDGGVNLLDVSPYYGETVAETRLGRVLSGIARDRYYLSTKVGRYGLADFDFSAARVTRSVDESLQRLQVDYVDLLLCHDIEFGSLDQIVHETLPALREVVKAGKARFLGVSGLPLAIFSRVLAQAPLDFVLSYCHYNLLDSSLDALLPYLSAQGVGVLNASPLGMGLLTGIPPPDWHPAPAALREAMARAATYCGARGVTLPDLAVAWSVADPRIAATFVGSASGDEMQHNLAALNTPPDPEILWEVRRLLRPVRDGSWPSGRPENDPEFCPEAAP